MLKEKDDAEGEVARERERERETSKKRMREREGDREKKEREEEKLPASYFAFQDQAHRIEYRRGTLFLCNQIASLMYT
jgi:hypothetical protein